MNLDKPKPFHVGILPYIQRNLQNNRCQFEDFTIVDKRNIAYEAFCNAEQVDIDRFCKLQCLSYDEVRNYLSVDDSDFLVGHWESPLHHELYLSALKYFQPEILETIDFYHAQSSKKKDLSKDNQPAFDMAYGKLIYE